jgi:hypothetical protein
MRPCRRFQQLENRQAAEEDIESVRVEVAAKLVVERAKGNF